MRPELGCRRANRRAINPCPSEDSVRKVKSANMAKRQQPDDWYLISIDRLKKIGLTVLIVAIVGGGYLIWDRSAKNPQERAEAAIADADSALNDLAGSEDFNSFKSE